MAAHDYSQLVVEVLVDLLGLAVLAEHTAEDTHAALPDKLEGQASVGRTPALSGAGVPPFPVLAQTQRNIEGDKQITNNGCVCGGGGVSEAWSSIQRICLVHQTRPEQSRHIFNGRQVNVRWKYHVQQYTPLTACRASLEIYQTGKCNGFSLLSAGFPDINRYRIQSYPMTVLLPGGTCVTQQRRHGNEPAATLELRVCKSMADLGFSVLPSTTILVLDYAESFRHDFEAKAHVCVGTHNAEILTENRCDNQRRISFYFYGATATPSTDTPARFLPH